MKYFSLIWMLLFFNKAAAQHIIYLADGTKMPGKITEITARKAKFKNLEDLGGDTYSRSIDEIYFAFNASGDYIVFSKEHPLAKKERDDFVNPLMKSMLSDVLVDINGNVTSTTIANENDLELICSAKGKKTTKVAKATLCFIIRRNGTHQVFVDSKQALPILISSKSPINNILSGGAVTTAGTTTTAPNVDKASQVQDSKGAKPKGLDDTNNYPDEDIFKKKSLEKAREFEGYIKTIAATNIDNASAKKAINLACDLFANSDARIEVSNINSAASDKYKVREYLNRLMLASGKFEKVQIDYVNINYVSKFIKGVDGNYHGTVSFVQTFKGFIDGKMIYGDVTKRTLAVVVKPYQKAVNGESTIVWDVVLGDIGVVQTDKIK